MQKNKKIKGVIVLVVLLGLVGVAFGLMGVGRSTGWREEVVLHDGTKIIVKRCQYYGGRHEIGQHSPIKDQSITFAIPGSGKTITWEDKFSKDVGKVNFELLALHILSNIPYIITTPNGCLAYNKWGRPNPPYVIFKYENGKWQQIPLSELPVAIKKINLVIDTINNEKMLLYIVSADLVRELNSSFSKYPNTRVEFQAILRTPLPPEKNGCGEYVYDGHGGWIGIGWFEKESSFEACLKRCERENMTSEYCPCDKIFKGEK